MRVTPTKCTPMGVLFLTTQVMGLCHRDFSCLRPIVEQRYSFWKYYIPYEETMRPILVKATKSGTMMNEWFLMTSCANLFWFRV